MSYKINIRTETIFNPIFNNQKKIINYIVNNISFFVIIISIIGGVNQAFKLILLSPSFIIFYSAKQGLVEGALFLVFVLFSFTLFYLYFFEIFKIFTSKLNSDRYVIFLWFIAITIWGIYGATTDKDYIVTFIFIPFLITFLLLVNFNKRPLDEKKIGGPKEVINLSLVENQKPLFIILLIFILIFYSSFFGWYTQTKEKDIFIIENFIDKENDLKRNYNENYILIYSNSEYVFYKNFNNNNYRIIKIENALD